MFNLVTFYQFLFHVHLFYSVNKITLQKKIISVSSWFISLYVHNIIIVVVFFWKQYMQPWIVLLVTVMSWKGESIIITLEHFDIAFWKCYMWTMCKCISYHVFTQSLWYYTAVVLVFYYYLYFSFYAKPKKIGMLAICNVSSTGLVSCHLVCPKIFIQ